MVAKAMVSKQLRDQANAKVRWCMDLIKKHYNDPHIVCGDIVWDVRGRNGGYYMPGTSVIHLNPILFNENVDDYLENTIPHEVAHLVHYFRDGDNATYRRSMRAFGIRQKRDIHGPGWKAVMRVFGIRNPARCHSYDVSNSQVRVKNKFHYKCSSCGKDYFIGPKSHKNILAGVKYWGLCCGKSSSLVFQTELGQVTLQQAKDKVEQKIVQPKAIQVPTKEVSVDKIISKKDLVRLLIAQYAGLMTRNEMISKIQIEVGMTVAGASTYYYNAMKV